jgi:ethanolamine utilization protein EutN
MILGRVIGEVWATKKHSRFESRKVMLVAVLAEEPEGLTPTGEVVVALDTIGARTGHTVTVSWGSGARAVFAPPDNRGILADAAISRIVDGWSRQVDGKEEDISEE